MGRSVGSVVLFTACLAGCGSTLATQAQQNKEQAAYHRAFNTSDPQAAEQFLAEYPNSIYASNMQDRLEVLEKKQQDASLYEPYRQRDTAAGYREFLAKYPDSAFIEEARPRIATLDPDGDFEPYRKRDTVEGYEEFLATRHTDHKYFATALERLSALTGRSTIVKAPGGTQPPGVAAASGMLIVTIGSLDQKTREAMELALKPLRLLAAAMETGMNYQQYGTRLIDAKMKVEGAIGDQNLNIPSDFKSEIYTIFDIYQDARLAWEWKTRQGTFCDRTDCSYSRDDSFVSGLFSKYPFLRSTITQEAPGGIFLPNGIWAHSRALSLLWAEAKAKTEKLAATVPPPPTTAAPPQAAEERLRNLKNLLDKKLITKDEYEKKRAEILKDL
jgi:hypothetical protein